MVQDILSTLRTAQSIWGPTIGSPMAAAENIAEQRQS